MHIWLHRVNRLFCLHQFLNSPSSFVDPKSKVMVTKCNLLPLWCDCLTAMKLKNAMKCVWFHIPSQVCFSMLSRLPAVCCSIHLNMTTMWPSYHRREETVLPFISSLTGTELCLVQHGFLPGVWVCVCVSVYFHPTHYDTVLSNVDIGTNLCCVDNTVLLDEDVVSDVQREERHSGKRWSSGVCLMGMQLPEITQNKSNP